MVEEAGDDEIDHRVAQKLQPLVVLQHGTGVLVEVRAVGQSARQEREVLKRHTQMFAELN